MHTISTHTQLSLHSTILNPLGHTKTNATSMCISAYMHTYNRTTQLGYTSLQTEDNYLKRQLCATVDAVESNSLSSLEQILSMNTS